MTSLMSLASRDMAIDLGTANTLVYVRGQGIVLNEPSVVAINTRDKRALAVGMDAKRMIGRTPAHIQAIRPLRDGVIADFDITERMLRYFIRRVHNRHRLFNPRVVIAIPSGITPVEKRAVFNSAQRAGARKVYLIEEPKAAGIGAGLPITEPVGSMIVDIGGGTTEVAVMSLGGVVIAVSIRVAGDEMDAAIIEYCKRKFNLDIGVRSAERVKIEVGSAAPLADELEMEIGGRDLIAGLPRTTTVTSQEIREALAETVDAIVDCVKRTLEQTEPELSADLVHNGITMCGGGALLKGLPEVISQATGLKVAVADDPLTAVARGAGIFLDHLDEWGGTIDITDEEM